MSNPETMILLFSDASGIYIPQRFANEMARDHVAWVSDEDYEILGAGPDHELYWDTWQDVIDDARVTANGGTVYALYQDGDCWLIRVGAEFNETGEGDMFVMPIEVQS
jgi:hypothetical protein